MAKAILEGWMVRYGRRKIGRSFFHKRYFVLESRVLAYYKRKPSDKEVPIKSLLIDGMCRVEDRGLETHHGHVVYVLSVYNSKDKSNKITMATFSMQEFCNWKENIELTLDQAEEKAISDPEISSSSTSDQDFQDQTVKEELTKANQFHSKSLINGDRYRCTRMPTLPTIVERSDAFEPWDKSPTLDDIGTLPKKHWKLVRCQNGLRIFEELLHADNTSNPGCRAMKAVGVVEAACEHIFALVMGMDDTRYEWDCTFLDGSAVEEVDGHTSILFQRLQLDFCSWLLWPRDLCYVRYWRRKDDNRSYVVAFWSREHPNCPPQPGCVRAHIDSAGFTISPLKPSPGSGQPRARVEYQVQIDLKGWGVGYLPLIQQRCLLKMLNSVAGLREWFSQRDGNNVPPSIHQIVKMKPEMANMKRERNLHVTFAQLSPLPDQFHDSLEDRSQYVPGDEDSDDDDDGPILDSEPLSDRTQKENAATVTASLVEEENAEMIDLSMFTGNLRRDDSANGKNCWTIPDSNNFRIRSKRFPFDHSKIPAGEPLMQLAAIDWFKDNKRMDHLARLEKCASHVATEKGLFTLLFNIQVPSNFHYSMVLYFVAIKPIVPGSLLQRFIDGDDGFRNSRLKLIPCVSKGPWIARQSVGTTPCILGKAVDCSYYRGDKYLEVDVDIGSSTIANGVLGLVFGVVTSLIVDMAFLIQGNCIDELPERLIGAATISHLQLTTAFPPPPLES